MSVEQETNTVLMTPHPFRPTADQSAGIARLHKLTGLSRALIVRKLVAFALPKFLKGEAQLVPDIKAATTKGGARK
jgi:hypothetical protein